MTIRLHVAQPLVAGAEWALPDDAARHAQVRRVQPGDVLRLFDGAGHEWHATVTTMGRRSVQVRVEQAVTVTPEMACRVTLAVGVPANERMDTLVEKATELGVAAIQPLLCERAVVRLAGERAERRRSHWQGIAAAACEQCGRATVPRIEPVRPWADWLTGLTAGSGGLRWVLSTAADAPPPAAQGALTTPDLLVLSGPEGGLSRHEEQAAVDAGFQRVSLGPRILRADTAPLVLLAWASLVIQDFVHARPGPPA